MKDVRATTPKLPGPVGITVALALRTAVRRWPVYLRDELAREWAAELHMIANDRRATAARRSWRCLTYAGSLAVSRGPERETTTWGYGMRKIWRPVVALLAAPLLGVVAIVALGFGYVTAESFVHPDPPGRTVWLLAWSLYGMSLVGLYAAGRWAGRRAALPYPRWVAAPSAAALAGTTLTLLMWFGGAEMVVEIGQPRWLAVAGVPVWAVVYGAAGAAAQRLAAAGRRRTALGVALGGAVLAVAAAVLVLPAGTFAGQYAQLLLLVSAFLAGYLPVPGKERVREPLPSRA